MSPHRAQPSMGASADQRGECSKSRAVCPSYVAMCTKTYQRYARHTGPPHLHNLCMRLGPSTIQLGPSGYNTRATTRRSKLPSGSLTATQFHPNGSISLPRGSNVLHKNGRLVAPPSTTPDYNRAIATSSVCHDSDPILHHTLTAWSSCPLPVQCFHLPPPVCLLRGRFVFGCLSDSPYPLSLRNLVGNFRYRALPP